MICPLLKEAKIYIVENCWFSKELFSCRLVLHDLKYLFIFTDFQKIRKVESVLRSKFQLPKFCDDFPFFFFVWYAVVGTFTIAVFISLHPRDPFSLSQSSFSFHLFEWLASVVDCPLKYMAIFIFYFCIIFPPINNTSQTELEVWAIWVKNIY